MVTYSFHLYLISRAVKAFHSKTEIIAKDQDCQFEGSIYTYFRLKVTR